MCDGVGTDYFICFDFGFFFFGNFVSDCRSILFHDIPFKKVVNSLLESHIDSLLIMNLSY